LSLCMIVKDEAENLERCLRSAAHLVREIVVVDTGSRDGSRETAARWGAVIVEYPWNGDFAAARNAGLRRASGRWILVLDADEELAEADPADIKALLSREDVYGWQVQMIHYIGERPGEEYVTDTACRLFRNDPRIAYEGRIHEDVEGSLLALGASRIGYAPLVIRHYGYLDGALARKKKAERNMALLREAAARHPDDLRLRYALGTEYFLTGCYEEALEWFRPLFCKTPVFAGYASDLAFKGAYCLLKTGRTREALTLAEEALLIYPDYADLWELKAVLLKDAERLPEALRAAEQAVSAGARPDRYLTASGSGTYRSHYLAGTICERMLRFGEAARRYRQALEWNACFAPAWARWARIAFAAEQGDAFLAFAAETCGHMTMQAKKAVLEAALDAGNKEECAKLLSFPGFSGVHPVLEAMLLAKLGEKETAARMLARCGNTPEWAKESRLCLWALGDLDEPEGLDADLVRCQEALIRCGAWDAWVRFLRAIPDPYAAPPLPPGPIFRLPEAPDHAQRAFLDLCRAWGERADYGARLAAGVMAHAAGDYTEALRWFASARSLKPGRLEPAAGLTASLAALAHGHHKGAGFAPAIPVRLLLLVYYM